MSSRWMVLSVVAGLVSVIGAAGTSGCKVANPYYCPDPADDCTRYCEDASDCPDTRDVCMVSTDSDFGTCVQCIDSSACSDDKPLCLDNKCEPLPPLPPGVPEHCTQHAECDVLSSVCLPEGRCAVPQEVAYADPGGTDNGDCTLETPCTKIVRAIDTKRPYVKVTGTFDETVVIGGPRAITILADPGAKIVRTGNESAFVVAAEGHLRVYDLEITSQGRSGITPDGSVTVELTRVKLLNSAHYGVQMYAGHSLSVLQSVIAGNKLAGVYTQGADVRIAQTVVSGNGGGLHFNRRLFSAGYPQNIDITNTFIVNNGLAAEPTSLVGGVLFQEQNGGNFRFEFNTVAFNNNGSEKSEAPGVECVLLNNFKPEFRNNLIYANPIGGGSKPQVQGGCTWSGSYIHAAGDGDPMFVDPVNGDFHLKSQSPIRNANITSTIEVDFDGDPRPLEGRADIGADEYKAITLKR